MQVKPIVWREFVVAPGMKIMVADGWTVSSEAEKGVIEARLRTVLEATVQAMSAKRAIGGTDE
jgi:hypothetical protein